MKNRSKKRISDDALARKVKKARNHIYKGGLTVRSTKVESLLKPSSLQPTEVRGLSLACDCVFVLSLMRAS
jgi:hypothetical protein